jgi:DNA-binding MarR family transcriptional regulator
VSPSLKRTFPEWYGAQIVECNKSANFIYDERLTPSGLSTIQFTLLSTLTEAAPISINRLAEFMEMDRTTLTRNLGLLMKQHLVHLEEGEDRRMRLMLLTGEGEQALGRAWPLWQEAQARIECAFGQ